MHSLNDFLAKKLTVLSIGLNPSLPSVRAGYYFANPRNRFWAALNASDLVEATLLPGKASQLLLLHKYAMGFTDVVKRPTASARQLRASDYDQWVPVLLQKIERCRPRMCWFHGKLALRNTLRVADIPEPLNHWGLQEFCLAGAPVFMSPNPSSANAVFRLPDLVDSYNQLAAIIGRNWN